MGFSRQEHWSGLPCPSSGDLPDPGIEPRSPLQADSLPSEPPVEAIARIFLTSLKIDEGEINTKMGWEIQEKVAVRSMKWKS